MRFMTTFIGGSEFRPYPFHKYVVILYAPFTKIKLKRLVIAENRRIACIIAQKATGIPAYWADCKQGLPAQKKREIRQYPKAEVMD